METEKRVAGSIEHSTSSRACGNGNKGNYSSNILIIKKNEKEKKSDKIFRFVCIISVPIKSDKKSKRNEKSFSFS